MTEQTLTEILAIMGQMGLNLDREVNNELIDDICHRFNDKLKFGPELQSKSSLSCFLIVFYFSSNGIQRA